MKPKINLFIVCYDLETIHSVLSGSCNDCCLSASDSAYKGKILIQTFIFDLSHLISVDINECELSTDLCRHGRCINLIGRYQCTCEPGYKPSDDKLSCVGKSFLRYYCKKR